MKKPNWRGLMRNDNAWKLKFHGIVATPEDRRNIKEAKAEREKWNRLSHRTDMTPRIVKP